MLIDRAGRNSATTRFRSLRSVEEAPVAVPIEPPAPADPRAIEFVRFCYLRRRVSWPELYDEMCLVAARGAFRGMGYDDLEQVGISFTIWGLPPLAQLAHRVVTEERLARSTGAGRGSSTNPTPHLTPVAG